MLLGAWVLATTTVLLVGPGALLGHRLRLPWPVALAAGAPITLAVVAVFTVFYGAVGIAWNLATAALAVAVSYLAAWGVSRSYDTRIGRRLIGDPGDSVARAPQPDTPAQLRALALRAAPGIAFGMLVITATSVRPLTTRTYAGLDSVPQIWDALWHASSLRWIHENGVGSSLRMGELMNYDTHGFNYYPNAWHALGALQFPLTGADTVALYNTYSPATLALTITLGVASLAYWLARYRFDVSTAALLAGAAAGMAALFPSLPYVAVQLTAVPNAVGVSLAPVAAVLTISAVHDRRRVLPAAVATIGVASTHPSGLIVICVLVGLWWLFDAVIRPVASRLTDLGTLATWGVLVGVGIVPVALGTLRIADNNELSGYDFRDDSATVWEALAQGAFNGTIPLNVSFPVWPLVGAAAAGALVLLWARSWPGLVAWTLFILITANSVVALGPLAEPLGAIGGYFYNAGHRLTLVTAMFSAAAAGIAIGALMLALVSIGSTRIRDADELSAGGRIARERWAVPVAAVLIAGLLAGGALWRYPANSTIAANDYGKQLIGPDDLAAYQWLAEQPDARQGIILNNLDQGTGWLYPVTGLTPLFPFYRANDFSDRQLDLFWNVADIGTDPNIDRIVRDLKVRYVIDSPPSYWWFQNGPPDPENNFPGDAFYQLRKDGAAGLDPAYQRGEVTIYRVDRTALRSED